MRLGQLARHLDRTTAEIVAFLEQSEVVINDHPNVKLSDESEQQVIAHFQTNESIQMETPPSLSTVPEDQLDNEPISQPHEDFIKDEVTESTTETISENTPESADLEPLHANDHQIEPEVNTDEDEGDGEEEMEVIKAPKIELPGLKVVGKIELPEPKAKTEVEEKDLEEESNDQDPTRIRYATHTHRNSRPRLTPEQREERRLRSKKAKEKRLWREAEQREEEEKRRLKAMKERHYQKKLAKAQANQKAPVRSQSINKQSQPKAPQPKTLLGRFWKWLNT